MHRAKAMAKNYAKNLAIKGAKTGAKFLIKLLLPYIAILSPVLLIVFVVIVVVTGTFSAMTSEGALTIDQYLTEDEALKLEYITLTNAANIKEAWLVHDVMSLPLYPDKGNRKLNVLGDCYGNDEGIKMRWGLPQAVALFYAYENCLEEVPSDIARQAINDLQPYFYYKESTITTITILEGKNGEDEIIVSKKPVKLLVESNTVDSGHYIYRYKEVTEQQDSNTTVIREVLDRVETISMWERLDNYLEGLYKNNKDVELTRQMVIEASVGYTNEAENMQWLLAEEESSSIKELIFERITGDDYAGGELTWPTPGNYLITSLFGNRLHPVHGVTKFHSGIDIGAPMGAKIVAAQDGKVIDASQMSGYGNVIILDHGGGIVTLYAHLSRQSVVKDQSVMQGDEIGKVGSTGVSTGPHLHFEVRVNGDPVDPIDYL